jgi:calcium-translocating P-type ATPase
MSLNDKARAKQMRDGGALATEWWAKVDELLYGAAGAVAGSQGLQVMARSLPDDKLKLVKRFMLKGEVVGVTGDGTNDAPALRHANVGLAMGSGTDVAKDAAEITITNDNFASIVQAIMWGRNIFDNIRKFLQFQLTVNVVALLLTFVMACIEDGESEVKDAIPLNAVMLLWVNLIMDSMGALALATEKPSAQLLDRPPHGKERLLSVSMIRMVIGQSVFQMVVLMILSTDNSIASYVCDCETDLGKISTRQKTAVFNAFVYCQFFNEINCRTIKEMNTFAKFFDSPWFTIILIFTAALQLFMVEVGGSFVGTNGLSLRAWMVTIAIGAIAIPVGFLVRLIPVDALEAKYGFLSDEEMEEEDEEDEEEQVTISTAKVAPEVVVEATPDP